MSVIDQELVRMGGDVLFWKGKVKELEAAKDHNTLEGRERLRLARQQLRKAQKALRDTRKSVQMRMFP
jgi:hypothetical protein